jgi:hypothetical protein
MQPARHVCCNHLIIATSLIAAVKQGRAQSFLRRLVAGYVYGDLAGPTSTVVKQAGEIVWSPP